MTRFSATLVERKYVKKSVPCLHNLFATFWVLMPVSINKCPEQNINHDYLNLP